MTELEDVFGEEFAQDIKQKAAERRQERNRVTEEQMMKICSLAINEGKFDPKEGDPMFSYTTDNGITHQTLLMQVPDPQGSEVWEHLSEPWEGAARLPLEYLGEWFWCTFPDKEELKKLDQGEYCIVVGSIEENENDSGEVFRNVYPVRGVATLDEAKEYAEQILGQAGFTEDVEEEEDTEEAEEKEDESDIDAFSGATAEMTPSAESDDDEETDDTSDEDSSSSGGLNFDAATDDDTSSSSDDDGGGGLQSMLGGDNDEEEEEEDDDLPRDAIEEAIRVISDDQDDDEEPQVYEVERGSAYHQRLTTVIRNRVDELNQRDYEEEDILEVVGDILEETDPDNNEEEEDEDMNQLF